MVEKGELYFHLSANLVNIISTLLTVPSYSKLNITKIFILSLAFYDKMLISVILTKSFGYLEVVGDRSSMCENTFKIQTSTSIVLKCKSKVTFNKSMTLKSTPFLIIKVTFFLFIQLILMHSPHVTGIRQYSRDIHITNSTGPIIVQKQVFLPKYQTVRSLHIVISQILQGHSKQTRRKTLLLEKSGIRLETRNLVLFTGPITEKQKHEIHGTHMGMQTLTKINFHYFISLYW